MDIKFENANKKEFFCNIKAGECFAIYVNTPNQMICMKIVGCSDITDNAIELREGSVFHFDDDEEVVLIDAELKVRLGG